MKNNLFYLMTLLNDLNIDKDGIPLEKQRKILNELVEENSFGFPNLKE